MKAWASLLLAAGLWAQAPAPLAATYSALLRPRFTATASVSGAALPWHGLSFVFDRGTLALGDHVAVFAGSGRLQVLPPNAVERQQMVRYSGASPLVVAFSRAVFRFSDASAFLRAWTPAPTLAPAAAAHEAEATVADADDEIERIGTPLLARLLRAFDTAPAAPLLLARLETGHHAWVDAQFDPSQPQPLTVLRWAPTEDGDVVPEVATRFAPAGFAPPAPLPALGPYRLDGRLTGHFDLEATAQFSVAAPVPPGMLLSLDPALRVSAVTTQQGTPLEWLRPERATWLYVRPGGASTVVVQYRGRAPMIAAPGEDGGSALAGWYPAWPDALPLRSAPAPAHFDVHLQADKKYVVLIGAAAEERPIARAGFALGPNRAEHRSSELADGRKLALTIAAPEHDAAAMIPLAGTEWLQVANFMAARFSPYPYASADVNLTGVDAVAERLPPAPGLVTFDPGSFLDLSPALTQFSPAMIGAGQWWGAWSRPAAPGDAWLVDGLRAASAWWFQATHAGLAAGADTLRSWQKYLAARQPGPLSLGAQRLTSAHDSGVDLLTAKGGYVIEMLHAMMLDPGARDPEAAFTAAMRDFAASHGGGPVTTAQFEAVVEKHMTPAMDLDRNHTMGWFFRPLLDGTGVPRLRFRADIAAPDQGRARVVLTVDNPEHWRGLLPVYIFRDADHYVRGLLTVDADRVVRTIPVPFPPRYVEANHFADMLLTIEQ